MHILAMNMRSILAALVLVTGAIAGDAAIGEENLPASIDSALIPNYRLVRPGLATAGRPTATGTDQLAGLGFRTVVNLMTEAEGAEAEEVAVKAAGLRYVAVPITPDRFRREDAEAVAKVLDDVDARPVLLHCASGNRVGGVWTVLEVLKGKPYEEAEAEGRKMGLQSPAMIAAVKRVLGLESNEP